MKRDVKTIDPRADWKDLTAKTVREMEENSFYGTVLKTGKHPPQKKKRI